MSAPESAVLRPGLWHPSREALERFLGGESPGAESMAIVRHALRGCTRCRLLGWWLWKGGLKKPSVAGASLWCRPPGQVVPIELHLKRRRQVADPLHQARVQMQSIVQQLDALKYRLLGVHASLPSSLAETDRFLEADQLGEASDLRTTIACVLNDYLMPAEEILGAASVPSPNQPIEEERGAGGEGKGGA